MQKGIYAPTLPAVRRRAAELRSWLWNRPEEHIALVTHGGFLHYLMEDWTTYDKAHSKLRYSDVNYLEVTTYGRHWLAKL